VVKQAEGTAMKKTKEETCYLLKNSKNAIRLSAAIDEIEVHLSSQKKKRSKKCQKSPPSKCVPHSQ
jgi:hypothetical protein